MIRCDRRRVALLCVFPLLCLARLIASPATAQNPPGDPDLVGMMKEAQSLDAGKKFEEACRKYEAIRSLARVRHDELWEARAVSGLAYELYRQARYPQAREKYLDSLAVFERLDARQDAARVNLGLGNVAWFMGKGTEAVRRYQAAAAAYDSLGDIGNRDSAVLNALRIDSSGSSRTQEVFQELVSDAERTTNPKLMADVLHTWGDRLYTTAAYGPAIEKLEQAESLYRQMNARDALATVYNSLGRIYRAHGQPAPALEFQLKALEIHQSLHSSANIIQSLNAVAVTYESLGMTAQARACYERALALARQTGSQRVQDFIRGNFANFCINQGEFARAAAMLEQVLANGLDSYPATRYSCLSSAYLRLGRDRDALEAAQKALDTCRDEETACLWARNWRARAHLALGERDAAQSDLRSAMDMIEDLHTRLVPSDFFKQGLHHSWEPLYSLAIELDYHDGKGREALEAAELARSRAFLDLLAERNLAGAQGGGMRQDPAGTSPPATDDTARRASTAPNARTPAGRPVEPAGERSPAPQGPASPLTTAAPTAGDLSAIAARLQATLLIYWVADDAVYAWVVNPEGVACSHRTGILRSSLQRLVGTASAPASATNARGAPFPAGAEGGASRATAWDKLYDILVRPVRKYLPQAPGARLTIVPHGPLLSLPFAALRDPRGSYLVEHYTLHYVPASAVLEFTGSHRPLHARSGPILLVADPASPSHPHGDPPFSRLPGARAEAEAVSRLFPKNEVTLLLGRDASEARVREESAGHPVIHFATHAVAVDGSPFDSYLALAGRAGSTADGLLTAQKIYGLHLDADLIVLSACRSAGGLVTGDGIAALGRAFFYAGTSSVMASLWNVPDQPTDRLVRDFYRFWLRGEAKDRALRNAQLGLLQSLRAGKITLKTPVGEIVLPEDPAFWAGFVLLGEPD